MGSYFADGTLLCYSPYDDGCVKEFRGRDPATINFKVKEGDLVFEFGYSVSSERGLRRKALSPMKVIPFLSIHGLS